MLAGLRHTIVRFAPALPRLRIERPGRRSRKEGQAMVSSRQGARWAVACLAAWTCAGAYQAALAQGPARTTSVFYPDFSDTADALLRNASGHVRDGQWA